MRNVIPGIPPAAALCCFWVLASPVAAQTLPWETFTDLVSGSTCGLINTNDAQLVLLQGTGQLVIVSGTDVGLQPTSVDATGFVFFAGFPVGQIGFANDGDGGRTLWWLSVSGQVVSVDAASGLPLSTTRLPTDFTDVPCRACAFWDDAAVCDADLDGVDDVDDQCPATPVDAPVDADGCWCGQLDDDLDGVNNCDDQCPFTPASQAITVDGCPLVPPDDEPDDPPPPPAPNITINFCGTDSATTTALNLLGLTLLSGVRRRII